MILHFLMDPNVCSLMDRNIRVTLIGSTSEEKGSTGEEPQIISRTRAASLSFSMV
jgi:hypothetical protein